MPRVTTHTKSKAGKTPACAKCHGPIQPGEKYHEWSFRYGGTYRQHTTCGHPKPSQLTQSKLSSVYSAIEGFEDITFGDGSELAEAMREVEQAARDAAEEYREAVSAMNMEGAGTENEERADQLESYADEVESKADDFDGSEFEPQEEEPEDDWTCPECGYENSGLTDDGTARTKCDGYKAPERTVPCGAPRPEADEPRNEDGETEEEWLDRLQSEANDVVNEHEF